jgi:hypothetical protein
MATQYTAGLTAGQILTASTMNSIGAAWESYTPTITNYVPASFVSKYTRINKLVIWEFNSIISSATSGDISLTLPVTASTTVSSVGARNFGMFFDSSLADSYILGAFIGSTTTVGFFFANSTSPTVFNGLQCGVNDELSFVLIYEAA